MTTSIHLIALPATMQMVGIAWYAMSQLFPSPYLALVWLESSIEAWIQGRIDLSMKVEG